jgi:methylphosphotriester-DNA--protein-cysteine methyltransferase
MSTAKRLIIVGLIGVLIIAAPAALAAAKVVGNTNSKVFHAMSCQYATCKHCTKYFASRAEAIEAGYRPGKCCKP